MQVNNISVFQDLVDVAFSNGVIKLPKFLLVRFPVIQAMMIDTIESPEPLNLSRYLAGVFDCVVMTLYGSMNARLLPLDSFEEFFVFCDNFMLLNKFLQFGHDDYMELHIVFSQLIEYQIFRKEDSRTDEFHEIYPQFKDWIIKRDVWQSKVRITDKDAKLHRLEKEIQLLTEKIQSNPKSPKRDDDSKPLSPKRKDH